jgi:hypothetical protein
MSSMAENSCLAALFLETIQTIMRCGKVLAWLQGHTRMHTLQSVPTFPQ